VLCNLRFSSSVVKQAIVNQGMNMSLKCGPVCRMFVAQERFLPNFYVFLVSSKPSTCLSNRKLFQYTRLPPIPVVARSKKWVSAVGLMGLWVRIPPWGMDICLLWVLSGRGLCDRPITHPE